MKPSQVPPVRRTVYRNSALIWFAVSLLVLAGIVPGLLRAGPILLTLQIGGVLALPGVLLLWIGLRFRLVITASGLRVYDVRCSCIPWGDLESVAIGRDRWEVEGIELTVGGHSFLAAVPAVRTRGIGRGIGRQYLTEALMDIERAHHAWLCAQQNHGPLTGS